jgi:hypothetical protein
MSAVKISDEGWVQDVFRRDPAPLLRAKTLPINQVLETAASWSNPQEESHRIRGLAIDDPEGEGWAWKQKTKDCETRA